MALISNPNDDAGPRMLGSTLTVTSIAVVVVATRIYVRSFMIQALGWDDYVMVLALALSVTGEGIIVAQVRHGGGRHVGDVDPEVYKTGMHLNFMTMPIYLWAICIVKISVGFSLLRIASEKKYKIIIHSIMVFMFLYTFGCFLTILLQCKDLAALWDISVPRQCWGITTLQALSFANVACSILTDFTFAILIPIPMLWRLQLNNRTKLSVIGILSLGLFACAAAIAKIPSLVNYGKVGDFLWDSRNITIWIVTELNIGILAGSIPALKPMFRSILGSSYARGNTPGYGYGETPGSKYGNTSGRHPDTNPKNFVSISSNNNKDEDFEAQSQISQIGLVGSNSIPLGYIEKTVTTTLVETEAADSNRRLNSWRAGHIR